MPPDDFVYLHEKFGPTVQGEGAWSGSVVSFIRLAGCPVGCPWCDTGYADGGKGLPRDIATVADLVKWAPTDRVVISGGEPFAQSGLLPLVQSLTDSGRIVHIETSGALFRTAIASCWITLSPKEHINPRYKIPDEAWARGDELKLVVSDGSEVDYYLNRLNQFVGPIYLQPEWGNLSITLPIVLALIYKEPRFRLSLQTHKFIGVQ